MYAPLCDWTVRLVLIDIYVYDLLIEGSCGGETRIDEFHEKINVRAPEITVNSTIRRYLIMRLATPPLYSRSPRGFARIPIEPVDLNFEVECSVPIGMFLSNPERTRQLKIRIQC